MSAILLLPHLAVIAFFLALPERRVILPAIFSSRLYKPFVTVLIPWGLLACALAAHVASAAHAMRKRSLLVAAFSAFCMLIGYGGGYVLFGLTGLASFWS